MHKLSLARNERIEKSVYATIGYAFRFVEMFRDFLLRGMMVVT